MSSSQHEPPKWADSLLKYFCRQDFADEILGDLHEAFYWRAKEKGLRKAKRRFVWETIKSLRPGNLKSFHHFSLNTMIVRNYLKTSYRSLIKDRKFSFINLVGLSLGMTVFFAIVLLVRHELGYDKFHSKADRIFEVIQVFQNADGDDPEIWTSSRLSGALRDDLSMVESAVSINTVMSTWVEANGKRFFEEEGIMSGPQFFEIFDFEFLSGNREQALSNKRSIVLTQSLAYKYFEYEDPIGKEVDLDSYGRFTVTGVLKDIPGNSYIQFNFILTQDLDFYFTQVSPNFERFFKSWLGDPVATFVLLDEAGSKDEFESQVSGMLKKYLGDDVEINPHYLLNLLDLHFNSHGIDGSVNRYLKGDFRKVQYLIGIAIIILVMACLNYINISTARYIKRTREVGVRKAMGAQNAQVTHQFLLESLFMVLLSFSIGLALVYSYIPYFNKLTGIDLVFDTSTLLEVLPYAVGTILLVTLLAGFYPAFHLSRFPAISVLRNMTISAKGNDLLRKGLLTVQYVFVISILAVLIIVNRQYSFMSNKSMGFDTEQLVILEINSGGVRDSYLSLKNDFLNHPDIASVTGLTRMIGGYRSGTSVNVNRLTEPDQGLPMRFYGMDEDGLSTLNLELISGDDFEGTVSLDSVSVILNETAAKKYGGDAIVGEYLEIQEPGDDILRAKVIGVVKDFHNRSMHDAIGPIVIGYYSNPFVSLDDIVIKLSGFNTLSTLESIEAMHAKYDTRDMLTWEFMDDMVQRAYEEELVFRNIFISASILSFFIALLGMIGLTSYSVTAKTKEIGIRKILGASFFGILNLEAKGLIRYLFISVIVSVPVSWWLAYSWLLNFEYRISISPLTYVAVIVFILLVALLVVFFIGRKVAASPPVNAIRHE